MAINSGVYAADGSLRVTVVDGTTHVGVYAADGSINVKVSNGTTDHGFYHWASGAVLVTVRSVAGGSVYAADGSLYVSETPFVHGSQHVTAVSGSLGRITTPILAMDPAWTTADSTPDFIADFDGTVAAGDVFRLQIQAAGGNWSSLLSDTTHTITAPEDAANKASLSNGSLSNGNYEARCNVTHGTTSNWSNTVSFTVAAVSANRRISSAGDVRISSTGDTRIFS